MEELRTNLELDTPAPVGRNYFSFDHGLLGNPMEQHKSVPLSLVGALLLNLPPVIVQGARARRRPTMEATDSRIVGSSLFNISDNHSALRSKTYPIPTATKLCDTIFILLDFTVPLFRKINSGIDPKDCRQNKEIKRLEQGLSGLLFTAKNIKCRIRAPDLSYDTERMGRFGQLLNEKLKGLCLDFLRVSQDPHASLTLNSILSKIDGPKWISNVRSIISIIIKHLKGKREEISKDKFLSMIGCGPVHIVYSPNRKCLELNVISYTGGLYFTRVEWHTSVRNKLVRLLLFEDWSGMEGRGFFPATLQPQEVKDPVCYVSRTIGGTDGSIIPPYAGRIRPVRTLKKRRRRRVVATGRSDTRSGRPDVSLERSIGLSNGNGSFHLSDPDPPPLWIYDTGASVSVTGDQSLLRGVHDAAEMRLHGVSGADLVSTKCGRVAGAVSLSGVRYFPGAMANLICGGLFGSLGCDIIQNAKGCTIIKGGQEIGGGRLLPNRTYSIDYLDDELLGGTICSGCQH